MAGLLGQVQQLDGPYKRDLMFNDGNDARDVRGRRLQLISYTSQVLIIFTVILACIINLSIGSLQSELWSSLLSLALGCMLPNPRLRGDVKQKQLLPSPTVQFQPELLSGQHDDSLHNSSGQDDRTDGRIVGMRSGGDSVQ
jgi:hypothetical protein